MFITLFGCWPLFSVPHVSKNPNCARNVQKGELSVPLTEQSTKSWVTSVWVNEPFLTAMAEVGAFQVPGILPSTVNQSINRMCINKLPNIVLCISVLMHLKCPGE